MFFIRMILFAAFTWLIGGWPFDWFLVREACAAWTIVALISGLFFAASTRPTGY